MPRLVLDREPEAPSRGLHALDGWLAGLPHGLADRVCLAAGEALGNACEHGAASEIVMEWTAAGQGGTLCVDDGQDLDPARFVHAALPEDPAATRGRGLYILTQVCDGIHVRPGRGMCLRFETRASD